MIMAGLPFWKSVKFPRESAGKNRKFILVLCVLSIVFFMLAKTVPLGDEEAFRKEMLGASKTMAEATECVKKCLESKSYTLDENFDKNRTGFIGLEYSSITTSIGSLESKRTTTNPNFAGLAVFLFKEAGVKSGDTIAVGASGSFPALIIAVLSAAKEMNLKPLLICSLGSSQWGANNPDFHLLSMMNCLWKDGIFNIKPIALSLGGDHDTAEDMDAYGSSLLVEDIRESGILYLHEPDLIRNVREKMCLYEAEAGDKKIKAFVNIGGGWPNMGVDSSILNLKPGLSKIKHIPPVEKRGVIYEMAAMGIPVIHLLYINGLAKQYGLPWDPVPLPEPGRGKIYELGRERQPLFIIIAAVYLLIVIIMLSFRKVS